MMPPFLRNGLKAEAEKWSTKAMVSACWPMEAWPIARGREDDIVFPEEKIFVAAAVFLGAVEQDAQLIVIFMPVVAVVHHVVDKAPDYEILPGPVQLIICKFHPSSSQNPNTFPCGKKV